jgi:hypothetical protein
VRKHLKVLCLGQVMKDLIALGPYRRCNSFPILASFLPGLGSSKIPWLCWSSVAKASLYNQNPVSRQFGAAAVCTLRR